MLIILNRDLYYQIGKKSGQGHATGNALMLGTRAWTTTFAVDLCYG